MGEFLKYSNETQSNIIPKEEFDGLVQEVFNTIAENLCRSLGPLGSSATILDGVQTEATKDGFAILKQYAFHNKYKRMIYNLIKAPCTSMNNTVGDGTTTAIALTNALFNRYQSMKNVLATMYRLPRNFIRAWDECIDALIEIIKSKAVHIDGDDYDSVYNIAYVTSNGNHEVSRNIADVYRESKTPSIKQKDSPTNKSYIKAIDGFDFPANLISDAYVRNEDLSVQYADVCTMVFDHKVDSDLFQKVISPINDVLRAMGKKLIVIAPYYDVLMCDTVVDQFINYEYRTYGQLNMMMVQYTIGKLEKEQLNDLVVILRSKIINQELAAALINYIDTINNIDKAVDEIMNNDQCTVYRLIGIAARANLTCTTGSMFHVANIEEDEKYQDTLRRANKDLEDALAKTNYENQSYSAKIYDLNVRIQQLEMKNYIYYVGADSLLQKNIIWDTIEDVIKCTRSAIKYGTVPGCQLTIAKGCDDLIADMVDGMTEEEVKNLDDTSKLKINILSIINNAVLDVYSMVLNGPERDGILKLIPRWNFTTEEGIPELQKETMDKCIEIINESIERNQVFDMETLEYNPGIITSAETDTMVLLAASELVKVLISGNQCIFIDPELQGTNQHTEEVYV